MENAHACLIIPIVRVDAGEILELVKRFDYLMIVVVVNDAVFVNDDDAASLHGRAFFTVRTDYE